MPILCYCSFTFKGSGQTIGHHTDHKKDHPSWETKHLGAANSLATSKFMDQLGSYVGMSINSEVPKENALSLPSPANSASFRGPRIGGNTGLAALLGHADAHGVAGAGGIR